MVHGFIVFSVFTRPGNPQAMHHLASSNQRVKLTATWPVPPSLRSWMTIRWYLVTGGIDSASFSMGLHGITPLKMTTNKGAVLRACEPPTATKSGDGEDSCSGRGLWLVRYRFPCFKVERPSINDTKKIYIYIHIYYIYKYIYIF